MSSDDVAHNTTAELVLRRSRIHTKARITAIETSQMLSMRAGLTADSIHPTIPAYLASDPHCKILKLEHCSPRYYRVRIAACMAYVYIINTVAASNDGFGQEFLPQGGVWKNYMSMLSKVEKAVLVV